MSKWVSIMSTSNQSLPNLSAASIPAHGDASALSGGQGFVPDVALIERLANELFAGVPGSLSGATPSFGSTTPPRNNDLAIPLTGGDPLDLHLDTSRTSAAPQLPVSHAWAPSADLVLPELDTNYAGEDVLRDLFERQCQRTSKSHGRILLFLG
jgi:hypothetical protein